MDHICLICNGSAGSSKTATDIFGLYAKLQSNTKLPDLLSGLLEKPINPGSIHSNFICKKCFKDCSEYDSIQVRSQVIKQNLLYNFKTTLRKHNVLYDDCIQQNTAKPGVEKKLEAKKIVLPASKLQPLPADFVIDVNKLAAASKANVFPNRYKTMATLSTTQSPTINLKVTVGSSVLTQSIKASGAIIQKKQTETTTLSQIRTSEAETNHSVVTSLMLPTSSGLTSNPVLSFNVNSLPKDFLSTAVLAKLNHTDNDQLKGEMSQYGEDVENTDEQPMEIDEDCSLSVVPVSEENGKYVFGVESLKKAKIEPSQSNPGFFDVGLLLSDSETDDQTDKKFVLGKVEIVNDGEDDEDQTIMVDEEGTTIIRVGSTHRVLYDGDKFVVDDEQHDNNDTQDSTEEAQIELQVSGDEETANAIIAAAQEQGGAFIKVNTGEMFRVKSVQSKPDDLPNNMVCKEDNGQFKCLLCEKNANEDSSVRVFLGDATSMMEHLKAAHDAKLYICRVCGKVMRRRALYTTHMLEHVPNNADGVQVVESESKGKVYPCGVCGRRYSSSTLLSQHMHTHTGARPHVCSTCDKSFASKYTYQAHLKTHQARPRPYKCEQCGKTFFTPQNLVQHEKTHLGVKDFICSVCSKAFATQHNLEVHGVIHTGKRPFVCEHCSKAFARRAELRDHVRIHTGERPFACDMCGATFTQRSNLHSHRRATHFGDKRHQCTHCGKRFKRRRLLEYHIMAVHTGERPLRCDLCPASFVYPEHFKKHARVHNGAKPYFCEVCGKSFNSRDNRNTHRFVHSEKKPYECLTCGAGYMRKQLLYAHMNTTGHVAESIVVNQPRVIKTIDNGVSAQLIDVHSIEMATHKGSDVIFEAKQELEFNEQDISTVGLSSTMDITTAIEEGDDSTPKLFIMGDKKYVIQDGKSLNLVQESDEPLLLQDLHESIATSVDDSVIAAAGDKLEVVQADLEATDENDGMMRLIQIQLPDGKSGWVAINKPVTAADMAVLTGTT